MGNKLYVAKKEDLANHASNTSLHVTEMEKKAWNSATTVEQSSINGNIKINSVETTVYTHPKGTNPHGTTKSDIGLDKVGNFKSISTVANQGLSESEKGNARNNIGLDKVGNFKSVSTVTNQGLSESEKENARNNIGLNNVATKTDISTLQQNFQAGIVANREELINHKNDTGSHVLQSDKDKWNNNTRVEHSNTNGNIKINSVETTVYTHPAYTNKVSGLYKVTVDNTGHVNAANPVTKEDIAGLGVAITDTTYKNATQSVAGLMSTNDKKKLDNLDLSEYVTTSEGVEYEDPERTVVAQAKNAEQLNNKPAAYYTNYNNLSNKPINNGQITSYPTGKNNFIRNIYVSTSDPKSTDGINGDIWIKVGE